MHDGAITFAIEGDVDLETYEAAVSAARSLVGQLDRARRFDDEIAWKVSPAADGLVGVHLRPCRESRTRAREVASSLDAIAAALVADEPIDAPMNARRAAWKIARLPAREGIASVIIATSGKTHRIPCLGRGSAMVPEAAKTEEWYVAGEVAELCTAGAPYMIVIDGDYDHPVCCYVDPAEAIPRPARVGDEVSVFGTVLRAPWFERPLEVTSVTKVEIEPDPANAWQRARGILNWKPGDEPAEVAIRRIRGGD